MYTARFYSFRGDNLELLIIAAGVFLDRITKLLAIKNLSHSSGIIIIKNLFSFEYLENRGAAFGILQGKTIALSIFTIIVLIGIMIYLAKCKQNSRLIKLSLSLVIGGALGNLYDRIVYGYVVDFILLHYKNVYYFPTFNVADMFVVVGTVLLAISILREGN